MAPAGREVTVSHRPAWMRFPPRSPREAAAPTHLGLDRQVEGTFLERQEVPVVVPRALRVDPHFELSGRQEAAPKSRRPPREAPTPGEPHFSAETTTADSRGPAPGSSVCDSQPRTDEAGSSAAGTHLRGPT